MTEQADPSPLASDVPDSARSPGADPGQNLPSSFFRTAIETANEGVWTIDCDGRTTFANARMGEMLGMTTEQLIGRHPRELLVDADVATAAEVIGKTLSGEPQEFEPRFRRADGSDLPTLGSTAPIRDDSGIIVGAVAMFSDLTARKAVERALIESERQARETATLFLKLLESSSDAIWMRDPDGRFQLANPPAARIIGGTSEPADIIGKPLADVWGAAFAAVLQAQTETLFKSGKSETIEERVFDSSRNGPAVFLSTKVPLYEDDGSPLGVLGISRDITDMKRVEQELRDNQARLAEQVDELQTAQQREQLLAREVDHRAKNLLAVVQSVVQLSRAGSVAELKEGLTGRIQAMARAHSLLADSRWEGVDLAQLVEEELAPFSGAGGSRLHYSGPAVLLRPAAAQSLALVLHELTTNAAKYGALSTGGGSLSVEWDVARVDGGSSLVLNWLESGAAISPPTETGFGSRLITTSIDRQLRGKVDRTWTADGLRCIIRIPTENAVVAA